MKKLSCGKSCPVLNRSHWSCSIDGKEQQPCPRDIASPSVYIQPNVQAYFLMSKLKYSNKINLLCSFMNFIRITEEKPVIAVTGLQSCQFSFSHCHGCLLISERLLESYNCRAPCRGMKHSK